MCFRIPLATAGDQEYVWTDADPPWKLSSANEQNQLQSAGQKVPPSAESNDELRLCSTGISTKPRDKHRSPGLWSPSLVLPPQIV